MEINWIYQNKEILSLEDFNENCIGFVYKITNNLTQHYYIGKKVLFHKKNQKLGKKETALITGPGRKPKTKLIISESDWKTYWGSSKELLKQIKEQNQSNFTKEIIELAYSKKQLTYLELKYQILNNVLIDPLAINDNIAGKFFKGDI